MIIRRKATNRHSSGQRVIQRCSTPVTMPGRSSGVKCAAWSMITSSDPGISCASASWAAGVVRRSSRPPMRTVGQRIWLRFGKGFLIASSARICRRPASWPTALRHVDEAPFQYRVFSVGQQKHRWDRRLPGSYRSFLARWSRLRGEWRFQPEEAIHHGSRSKAPAVRRGRSKCS